MDGYTFTFVFLATMATLGVTAGLPATSNKISSLENLGSLNGTEYYRDSSHKHVSWNQVKSYCNESGLKMVSIETSEQATFLASVLGVGPTGDIYWTSGRDSRTIASMAWDDSGNAPNAADFLFFGHLGNEFPYEYCLIIMPYFSSGLFLTATFCSLEATAICQSY